MEHDNLTPAEKALLFAVEEDLKGVNGVKDLNGFNGFKGPNGVKGLKVLVAGNRSGHLPCALAQAGADVTAHLFDCYHVQAMRTRLREAGFDADAIIRCTAQIPEGPYDRAYFMTTPLSMTGELVLDQLEDIRANLALGGQLFSAFEGDADEALKTMKKVFARVHVEAVAKNRKRRRGGKRTETVSLLRAVKSERDAAAQRRNFAADWTASVPGGPTHTFVSLPGCFCHRRADLGGLSLAEVAAALSPSHLPTSSPSHLPTSSPSHPLKLLDMGCGCGFVGLLVADHLRAHGVTPELTLLDSHARALAAARVNSKRLNFSNANFILSCDGLPPDAPADYDLFLGNPPYYGDWKIAETFVKTAFRALRSGGRCLTVAKSEGGLQELQARIFGKIEVLRRRGYFVFSSIRP